MRRMLMMVAFLLFVVGVAWASGGAQAGERSAAVRPVPGAVVDGFESPEEPWSPGSRGVRLVADPGSPVHAALDGVVRFAGDVAGASWVTVDHGGGLDTTYGVDPAVPVGRRVRAGQVIGTVAEGAPAVHWGARRDGAYIDPMTLLGRWRVRLVADGREG